MHVFYIQHHGKIIAFAGRPQVDARGHVTFQFSERDRLDVQGAVPELQDNLKVLQIAMWKHQAIRLNCYVDIGSLHPLRSQRFLGKKKFRAFFNGCFFLSIGSMTLLPEIDIRR